MFPIYAWGTESEETESKHKHSTTQATRYPRGSAYGGLRKHYFWPSTQCFPTLCYKLVTGVPEIAKLCPWWSWEGLGQMDTQVDGLWSPQPLQACHTRVFRAPHKSCYCLFMSCCRKAWKTPSSFRTASLSIPGFYVVLFLLPHCKKLLAWWWTLCFWRFPHTEYET